MSPETEFQFAMTHPNLWVFHTFIIGKTYLPADRMRNVIALKAAKAMGLEEEVKRLIMDAHREHLIYDTLTQRRWQSSTSRRPQRTRNHDSWSIRERYVRCASRDDGTWHRYAQQIRNAYKEAA